MSATYMYSFVCSAEMFPLATSLALKVHSLSRRSTSDPGSHPYKSSPCLSWSQSSQKINHTDINNTVAE